MSAGNAYERAETVARRSLGARGASLLSAAALAVLTLTGVTVRGQQVQVSKDNRTVTVTATERVVVMADVATVHVGFIVYGKDKDTAYASGTQTSSAIIKALADAGIPKDSVESDSQSVQPVENYQVERMPPADAANRKFQVQQSWLVRTDAESAAHVLDVAVLAGANQSGQVDWSLKDDNTVTAGAAARAIQRAQSVAGQMVQGFGGKVGPLLYASNENETSTVRPVPMMAMHRAADSSEPLQVNPRRIEKSVTVRAIFAIE